MADLDLRRFQQHVKQRIAARPADVGSDGRRRTGVMEVIRANLARFDEMRANGATWVDIADALTAQGFKQRSGAALTADRVTALVASVRREAAKRAGAVARRAERIDGPSKPIPPPLALSADLTDPKPKAAGRPSPSEQDNRHAALDRAKSILK